MERLRTVSETETVSAIKKFLSKHRSANSIDLDQQHKPLISSEAYDHLQTLVGVLSGKKHAPLLYASSIASLPLASSFATSSSNTPSSSHRKVHDTHDNTTVLSSTDTRHSKINNNDDDEQETSSQSKRRKLSGTGIDTTSSSTKKSKKEKKEKKEKKDKKDKKSKRKHSSSSGSSDSD